MHMRRTIGISLAFLVISAGAMAKTPEKLTCHHPGQPHGAKPQKGEPQTVKRQPASSRGAHSRYLARYATHHAAPPRDRHAFSPRVAHDNGGAADSYLAPARGLGAREIGKAAWYNFVGGYTSTGERLDAVTATAAHRTLPLSSYAKVTNLDSGRSVIVKINDRHGGTNISGDHGRNTNCRHLSEFWHSVDTIGAFLPRAQACENLTGDTSQPRSV